ncbi:phosphatase PAP2 family protein [Flavobacterium algicola]|uniref:phosphatase PAP2 family protein n=1 Tax=Flavobacterium algicola TaxID=556529 RepID=UPI001EFC3C53|nr:phosphatase PAP2 family protein [Flavobacterium algicola]MCG9791404.1 phosphatase PAP2 family protein [Flavobacterium algicola]
MIESIVSFDRQLFIFLNSLGSESYDGLWLFITKQSNWTPIFLFFLYLIYKKLGTKQTLFVLLFVAILIAITDQVTNMFKYGFERLRPGSNPEINTMIRVVKSSSTFSFFSGHAANSMASAVFIYKLIQPYYRQSYWIFLWPLIFAYSRIYLGLHYPGDILCGYLFGAFSGYAVFKMYKLAQIKYFPLT